MNEIQLNLEFCCTCLKVGSEDDKFLSIRFAPPEDISYENKLRRCVPEMGLEDANDFYLCKPCSVALETAYTFRCMCIKTYNKLKEFGIPRSKDHGSADRDVKSELLETMHPEEIAMDLEQTDDVTAAAQPAETDHGSCSASLGDSQDPPVLPQEFEDSGQDIKEPIDIEEMDVVELLRNTAEECAKESSTKIETVKDQLGSLLSESLGNTIDINIHIFDKSKNSQSEFSSEISIFNSLNAEIEELSKVPPSKQEKDAQEDRSIIIKDEAHPKILKNLLLNPRRCLLSDAEILKNACASIPELHNCPVEALKCQVTLERITVTSLPVKLPKAKKRVKVEKMARNTRGKEFWCNICKQNVYRRDRFIAHILKHSNIKGYKCETCQERFFSGEALSKHKRSCVGVSTSKAPSVQNDEKPIQVPETSNEQKSKVKQISSSGKTGILENKEKIIFKFRAPKQIRKSQRKRKVPTQLLHLTDQFYSCRLCSYQSYAKQKYQRHMLTHTDDRKFKCETCSKGFLERCELNRHLRNVHSIPTPKKSTLNSTRSSARKIVTPKAVEKKKAVEKEKPKTHENHLSTILEPRITLTVNQGPFGTPVVQSFSTLTAQDDSVEMSYSCQKCNISFKSRNLLFLHTQTHEWKHRCDVCKWEFNSEKDLQEHAQSHQEVLLQTDDSVEVEVEAPPKKKWKKKKFFCNVCELEFSSRDHANIHTGKKPYKCKVCERHFAAYNTLRRHKVIHQSRDERQTPRKVGKLPVQQRKKYSCEICKKEFFNKGYVHNHSCRSASGEAVYRCQICREAFIGRTALIEHMGTHINASGISIE